eukprot:SAG22_NODE_331_length_12174_cov_12.920497_13_plen_230_part_01
MPRRAWSGEPSSPVARPSETAGRCAPARSSRARIGTSDAGSSGAIFSEASHAAAKMATAAAVRAAANPDRVKADGTHHRSNDAAKQAKPGNPPTGASGGGGGGARGGSAPRNAQPQAQPSPTNPDSRFSRTYSWVRALPSFDSGWVDDGLGWAQADQTRQQALGGGGDGGGGGGVGGAGNGALEISSIAPATPGMQSDFSSRLSTPQPPAQKHRSPTQPPPLPAAAAAAA